MLSTAVALLAGGEGRRFPGKLEHTIEGRAMVVRSYEAVRATGWPVYIAGKASFSPSVDARLDAPLLIDRRPYGGPLAAFLSACAQIRADRIFAIAADQPRLDAAVLARLAQMWRPTDEAVVPGHDGEIEPLAALYSRRAVLREGFALQKIDRKAMRDLIGRVAARFVEVDAGYFHNVNRREDVP
jgi:molybdopterin-guanine dinucleotide biosynthesis protein A